MGTHLLGPGLGGLGAPVAGQEAGPLCFLGLTVWRGGVLIVHSLLLMQLALGAFLMVNCILKQIQLVSKVMDLKILNIRVFV